MAKPKTVMVPLGEILEKFYVRKGLNDDRVLFFAGLYEANAEVPPIKIVRDSKELVDGRHRKAAQEMLGRTEIECILREPAPLDELMMEALADNVGGALPPTKADLHFVFRQLLEAKVSRTKIVERIQQLTPFPPSLIRRYMATVQSEMAAAKVHAAAKDVRSGELNAKEAAEKHDVDIDTLRHALGEKKADPNAFNFDSVVQQIVSRFRSTSLENAGVIKRLFDAYEDHQVTEAQVQSILDKLTRSIKQMSRSHADWIKRFNALTGKNGDVAEDKEVTKSKPQTEGKPSAKKDKSAGADKSVGARALAKMGL